MMLTKRLFALAILLISAPFAIGQDATSQTATTQQPPDPQQQAEQKAKLEKKAIALLEQVISDSQGLKLPENKVRVDIVAGDILWEKNATRARGLLSDAGAMLAQMMLEVDRTDRDEVQSVNQLRQELVLTAGRHDGDLGYQMLRLTQPQAQNGNNVAVASNRRVIFDQTDSLEQRLLGTIAANDPKFAYQKVLESLEKGDFPNSITTVLAQLQTKDEDAFKKLSDKTLNALTSDTLLGNRQATSLAMNLLQPGPRPESAASATAPNTANLQQSNAPVLSQTAYHDLMDNAITGALSVTSAGPIGNQQRGGGMRMRGQQPQPQTPPDDAQTRQTNARLLLFSMQTMMPLIEQYDPERSASVKQKLTDLGMNNNAMMNLGNQMRALQQQGSSDMLVTAATSAPPQIQSRLYQQAAQRAIDEGNTDKAVQIANDHLDESGRASIMQAVDFKKLTTTASPEKLSEIKAKLATLPSDSDRVKYLIDLATATQKDNPKLALRFLDDARALVAKRAMDYKDFEDQIKVADAYAGVDSKRSFEIVDAGIGELNELLNAATVLNGFEVDIFKDGELSLHNNSDLVGMVSRFGEELASLAKVDFDGARSSADKFQLPEPRLNARLSIVQSILGTQPLANLNNRRGQNFQFFMR